MTTGPVGDDAAAPAAVLAGLRAGKPMRAIAVELHGADRAAAEWDCDGRMRAKVGRLVRCVRTAPVGESGAAAHGTP